MVTCKDCVHFVVCKYWHERQDVPVCRKFMPVANTVVVVRCKDCLYRGRVADCPMMHLGIYGAIPPYNEDVDLTEDEGFCNRGIRSEEAGG